MNRSLSFLLVLALSSGLRSASAQNGPLALGGVTVTPDGGTEPARASNTGPYSTYFTVENTYNFQATYQLNCFGRNNVTCTGLEWDGLPITQITLAAHSWLVITASYSVGGPNPFGRLVLEASGPAQDTGYYNISIIAATAPVVSLRNNNGDNRDRSLCLTSGAGEAAAWQCGDLMVSHGLPAYSTMGRERSLALVYNSAQSVPRAMVAASVTQGSVSPNQVLVLLAINGVHTDSAFFNGWSSGTRQVVISHDASSDSSGLYPFTLIIRNIFPGSVLESIVSDTLIVVNRSGSLYGAGWGPAGVEELRLNQPGNKILWVGGDGSAKAYRPVNDSTWLAAAGAFRDTLNRFDSAAVTWWRRTLRHGISVTYRVTGSANHAHHVRTTNRYRRSTFFTWSGDTLKKVAVPPDTTSSTTYTLAYAGGRLDRITDPIGRILDVTVSSNRLTQIIDPDSSAYHTDFAYDALGRMTGRTTRRGYTTTFAYGNALRVTSVTIPVGRTVGDTTTARTTFSPWDEKGLAVGPSGQVAIDTGLAYTRIDGPRLTPVADTAIFWVDRWGGSTKSVDPIGATVTVQRGDPAVPALITQVQYPNGRIIKLSWNSRGNLTQSRDSSWHLADTVRLQTAVSRWTYPTVAGKEDSPDSTIDSTSAGRVFTRYSYDSLGLTDSVIAPNGHVTRFFNRTAAGDVLRGLLDSVVERQVPVWVEATRAESTVNVRTKFLYNAMGNLIRSTSPAARVDSLGRDTTQRVVNRYDAGGHRVETVYDPLNRVLQSIQHVEGIDSGFSVPLTTTTHYAIDLMDQLSDPRAVPRNYAYDFSGRRVVEIDDYGKRDSTFYDRAGLVDSMRPRFYQGVAGTAVRFTYDNAGRVTKKTWPARDSVPSDSTLFTYDVMGNVLSATQANWKIVRTFYANGSLRSEIQSLPDGSHRFTLFYAYDRVGRRAWYRSGTPGVSSERDSVWYSYDPASGELRTVSVRWRGSLAPLDSVRFRWDALGRRDSVIYNHGLRVKFAYNADGTQQLICGTHSGGPGAQDVFDFTKYDSLNSEGLVVTTSYIKTVAGCGTNAVTTDVFGMTYDSRHQLLEQTGPQLLRYRYDGSGNMTVQQKNSVNNLRYFMDPLHNRLRIFYDAAQLQLDDSTKLLYLSDGSRLREQPHSNGNPDLGQGTGYRYYWYDGLGRTTGTGEWQCIPGADDESGPGATCQWGQFYSYPTACRYDPLGRMYDPCENGATPLGFDGENVVRTGGDADIIQWSFVHGPGLDDPIMGFRNAITLGNYDYLYYVTDGQGRQLAVADTTGRNAAFDVGYRNEGKFAGGARYGDSFFASRYSNQNMPKISFFRNRFYDQATGRWTQEDPAGLSGGVNLYQFNGNNPVAYTDPFGLCASSQRDSDTTQTRYADLSERCVAEGDTVQQGDLIGYTGASGSGEPHLHFEVCQITSGNGVARGTCDRVEPLSYLAANGGTDPLEAMHVTSPFGPRVLQGVQGFHQGVDLRARTPQPVYAAFSGVVSFSGQARGYGQVLYINH